MVRKDLLRPKSSDIVKNDIASKQNLRNKSVIKHQAILGMNCKNGLMLSNVIQLVLEQAGSLALQCWFFMTFQLRPDRDPAKWEKKHEKWANENETPATWCC